jgi:predicted PurR-regulated permease PerM
VHAPPVTPERAITFPVRTVITVVAVLLGVWIVIDIVSIARQIIVWILIAAFFAVALNPLVELLQRRVVKRRGAAVGLTFLIVLAAIAGIGASFVPTLVDQVNQFVDALPSYVDDVTKGRGRLGFLETDYHIVDKVREQVDKGGAGRLLGFSGTAVAVTKGVLTVVVAILTITFLTLFMLLEGPAWVERFYSLLGERSEERWRRIGQDVYRTIGGYVTGNLLISLIAGFAATMMLLIVGVQYAVALGLIVALFDLIPLAGATIGAILVTTIAGISEGWKIAVVVAIFFLVYQQLENHVLQPLIYGRTVQLSPLTVLVAVLIGGAVAGVLGALGAIPVAGTIQVLIREYLTFRRERLMPTPGEVQSVEIPH